MLNIQHTSELQASSEIEVDIDKLGDTAKYILERLNSPNCDEGVLIDIGNILQMINADLSKNGSSAIREAGYSGAHQIHDFVGELFGSPKFHQLASTPSGIQQGIIALAGTTRVDLMLRT